MSAPSSRRRQRAHVVAGTSAAATEPCYQELFRGHPEPMWVFDEETLRIVEVNDAALTRYGYRREQFLELTITALRPAEEVARLRRHFGTNKPGRVGRQVWKHCAADGTLFDVEVSTSRVSFAGRPCVVVLAMDASDRLHKEHLLAKHAETDPLTGLPNRLVLMQQLQDALASSDRPGQVAVVFIDLDRFRVINDGLGHAAGDRLIVAVAERLCSAVRISDGLARPNALTDAAHTVARLGGDEFVVVLRRVTDRAAALAVADRLAWRLEEPFRLSDREIVLSASLGLAIAEHGEAGERLLARAEAAVQRAKELGRGLVHYAEPADRGAPGFRLQLECDMRHAIEHDELVLHYQPIVEVATGDIVGAEALARWRHPERGLVGPDQFIPAAEDSGLIAPLGEWVLRRALEDAATWASQTGRTLAVSVNLSAHQLRVPNLPFLVARALSAAGVEPQRLHLEITESALMGDFEHACGVLEALRGLGVKVDVDDFGTGYSSLSQVRRLPVDTLKIDRSFLHVPERSAEDAAVLSAIVELGESLRLDVIAEGVETADEHDLLREIGCSLAQGYHFARPMPVEELIDLLGSHHLGKSA